MRMQFEKAGYEVMNVRNAEACIKETENMQPDIILMDVGLMGNSSGIEAAIKIREKGIQTPIIFTTGNAMDKTINSIKNIPNSKVLIKPVEFDQLRILMEQF